jgi:hypothetical protein
MQYQDWLSKYQAFRKRAAAICGRLLPTEPSEVEREAQELEPLGWEAMEMHADAEFWYRQAMESKIKRASQIWALTHAKGTVECINSRALKIAQSRKLLDNNAPRH